MHAQTLKQLVSPTADQSRFFKGEAPTEAKERTNSCQDDQLSQMERLELQKSDALPSPVNLRENSPNRLDNVPKTAIQKQTFAGWRTVSHTSKLLAMVDVVSDQQPYQAELDSLTDEEASLYLKLMRLQAADEHDPTKYFMPNDMPHSTTTSTLTSELSSSQDNLNLSALSATALQTQSASQEQSWSQLHASQGTTFANQISSSQTSKVNALQAWDASGSQSYSTRLSGSSGDSSQAHSTTPTRGTNGGSGFTSALFITPPKLADEESGVALKTTPEVTVAAFTANFFGSHQMLPPHHSEEAVSFQQASPAEYGSSIFVNEQCETQALRVESNQVNCGEMGQNCPLPQSFVGQAPKSAFSANSLISRGSMAQNSIIRNENQLGAHIQQITETTTTLQQSSGLAIQACHEELPQPFETGSEVDQTSIEYDLLQMIDSDRSFSAERHCSNSENGVAKSDHSTSFVEPFNFTSFTQLLNQKHQESSCQLSNTSQDPIVQMATQETLTEDSNSLTLKLSSTCFVPSSKLNCSNDRNSQLSTEGDSMTSGSLQNSRETSEEPKPCNKNGSGKERFHAGATKWGKYKKKEQESKKRKSRRHGSHGKSPQKQKKTANNSSSDLGKKDNFDFPDGGWVCGTCQNYNFQGRLRCNRCHKNKSVTDFDGKPKHLIKGAVGAKGDAPRELVDYQGKNALDNAKKIKSIENAFMQVSIRNKNQILDESPAKQQVQSVVLETSQPATDSGNVSEDDSTSKLAASSSQLIKKVALTERVGDWVCLNCNNLNFSFRNICNRCDMDRMDVGKTIMSQQELENVKNNHQEHVSNMCEAFVSSFAKQGHLIMDCITAQAKSGYSSPAPLAQLPQQQHRMMPVYPQERQFTPVQQQMSPSHMAPMQQPVQYQTGVNFGSAQGDHQGSIQMRQRYHQLNNSRRQESLSGSVWSTSPVAMRGSNLGYQLQGGSQQQFETVFRQQ